MQPGFNYRHLYYFWVVAHAGSLARAAARLDLAIQTISAQLRLLEQDLGTSLLILEGRRLQLTDAGRMALHEANSIFELGQQLPQRVRDAASGPSLRLRVGIPDGVAKWVVHAALAPILATPSLRLHCSEGDITTLLTDLAMHKLDCILADQLPPPNPALRLHSNLLINSHVAWFGVDKWLKKAKQDFPNSLAKVPVLLPSSQSALRLRLNAWFERLRIRPNMVGEFADSAMLSTFGAAGMGVFAAPIAAAEGLAKKQLHCIAQVEDLVEPCYLIHNQRKLQHPLLMQLCAQAPDAALSATHSDAAEPLERL